MNNKPTITFDLDGVIVGGEYEPDWEFNVDKYYNAPTLEQDVKNHLIELSTYYNIYYISARHFTECGLITVQWLLKHRIPICGGVLVNVPAKDKYKVIAALGSSLHVDDHPVVIKSIKNNLAPITLPVMFLARKNENTWWDMSKETYNNSLHASNWSDLVYLIRSLVPV